MICNAVAHRSYLHSSSIQVAIYDNRVEVISPGMLFGSLRLADIKEGISIPRNRALVYAFTYMNIMEHWGGGIPRIIRWCRELGMEEPEMTEIAGSFRINLYRFSDKMRIGKNNTEKVRKSTDKKKSGRRNLQMNMDNLNENQKNIIQYVEDKGKNNQ